MSHLYLSRQELELLTELEDGRWRGPVELGDKLSIAPFNTRSSLAALRRFHLVERGQDFLTVGKWRISSGGRRELAQRSQLRLV